MGRQRAQDGCLHPWLWRSLARRVPERLDQEPAGVGDVVAGAMVGDVVGMVEGGAIGFLVAESKVERGRAGGLVVGTQADVVVAGLGGRGPGCGDGGRAE